MVEHSGTDSSERLYHYPYDIPAISPLIDIQLSEPLNDVSMRNPYVQLSSTCPKSIASEKIIQPLQFNKSPGKVEKEPNNEEELAKDTLHASNDVISKEIYLKSKIFTNKRRKRVAWTDGEIRCLEEGIDKYGVGKWAKILKDPSLAFQEGRTYVDLKDKWRNYAEYVHYSAHKMRQFIVINEYHEPLINPRTARPFIFKNRWPRDAAEKAATRDCFYDGSLGLQPSVVTKEEAPELFDENNFYLGGKSTNGIPDFMDCSIIFMKEFLRSADNDGAAKDDLPQTVHVYKIWRNRVCSPNHLSLAGIKVVWKGWTKKLYEETYFHRKASQEDK